MLCDGWKTHILPLAELKRGGANEGEAAANIRLGVLPTYSGIYNSHYMSDGAAMHTTPIGIICAGDPERAARLTEINSSISHSCDGLWGAQAVAVSIAVAMVGATVNEIYQFAIESTPKDSWKPLHDALWTE